MSRQVFPGPSKGGNARTRVCERLVAASLCVTSVLQNGDGVLYYALSPHRNPERNITEDQKYQGFNYVRLWGTYQRGYQSFFRGDMNEALRAGVT